MVISTPRFPSLALLAVDYDSKIVLYVYNSHLLALTLESPAREEIQKSESERRKTTWYDNGYQVSWYISEDPDRTGRSMW